MHQPQLLNEFKIGTTVLVNKPFDWTSFDVVKKLRKYATKGKMGHAGTLDPLATGLLIMCTGNKTKSLHQLQGLPKKYSGTFTLGATTPTYDLESQPTNPQPYQHLTLAQLQTARNTFLGQIEQMPPIHSAVKINGKPAYIMARKGQDVVLKTRQVNILEFEISYTQLPIVHFNIHCTSGTYIRSMAHDFGQALGCGAYLSSLRRDSIGEHLLTNAWNLEDLITALTPPPLPLPQT